MKIIRFVPKTKRDLINDIPILLFSLHKTSFYIVSMGEVREYNYGIHSL